MTNNQRVLIEIKERGYKIDKEGRLYNPKGKEVKGTISKPAGYKQVSLRLLEFSAYKLMFHRIQAYTKFGDKMFEKGLEVRHLNGNKLDNSFDNIEVGTHSENMMDIPELKRRTMSGNPKYNHGQILEWLEEGKTYKEIEDLCGAIKSTISYIQHKSLKAQGLV